MVPSSWSVTLHSSGVSCYFGFMADLALVRLEVGEMIGREPGENQVKTEVEDC